jgi:hypothetical protein
MKPVAEEDRDDKVSKAHAREGEAPQNAERPESHLELALRLSRIFERKDKAQPGRNNADGGQRAEDDEKRVVWQRRVLSTTCVLKGWIKNLSDEENRTGLVLANHENEGTIDPHHKIV